MQILELHKIKLSSGDQMNLKKQFEKKGGFVNYKEVLQYIQPNQQAEDVLNSNWVLITPVSHNKKGNGLSSYEQRSRLSSRQSNFSTASSVDQILKEKAQKILNNSFQPIHSRHFTMDIVNESQQEDDYQQQKHQSQSPTKNFLRRSPSKLKLEKDYKDFTPIEIKFNTPVIGKDVRDKNQEVGDNEENVKPNLKQILRKKQQIAHKNDQKILNLQTIQQEKEIGLLTALQPVISPAKEGKKKFLSQDKYEYNDLIGHDPNHQTFERKYDREYPDYNSISPLKQDQDPSQTMPQQPPHKQRISVDYMKKILYTNDLSDTKSRVLKMLYDENIDFRFLNQLKQNLLESDKVENNSLPIEEYIQIKNRIVKDKIQNVEDLLLQEIKTADNKIDLIKFSEIIDLFTYFPVKVNKDRNRSDELYYIMTSNQRNQASASEEAKSSTKADLNLQQLMEIVWTKINERFQTIAQAFRFFDANSNLQISFNEFFAGLERLRVKITPQDAQRIFNYLDKDNDQQFRYNDFCELCDEKRLKIDPYQYNQSTRNQTSGGANLNIDINTDASQPKSIYLKNVNIDQLDMLTRFKPLSKIKKPQNSKLPGVSGSSIQGRSESIGPVALYKNDDNFGGPSNGFKTISSDKIKDVINQQYLKDSLRDQITRNALLNLELKSFKPKSIHNKSSTLRSKSVSKQIELSNFDQFIENIKLEKAENKNSISFFEIQKQVQRAQKKDLALPPILKNSNTIDESQIRSRNNDSIGMKFNNSGTESVRSFPLQTSPIKRYNPLIGSRAGSFTRPNAQEILDEIHQMRMDLINEQEKTNTSKKPTMTKREREDIITSYFLAKKQLNNTNGPQQAQDKL